MTCKIISIKFFLIPLLSFSTGLNTPTLCPWKRYLKVNHTSTLSCNCEYSRVGLCESFFVRCVFKTPCFCCLPHTACHMQLIALCNTLTCARARAQKQTLYSACLWAPVGSSPSHLQPVSLPPTSAAEMSERDREKGQIRIRSIIKWDAPENINH